MQRNVRIMFVSEKSLGIREAIRKNIEWASWEFDFKRVFKSVSFMGEMNSFSCAARSAQNPLVDYKYSSHYPHHSTALDKRCATSMCFEEFLVLRYPSLPPFAPSAKPIWPPLPLPAGRCAELPEGAAVDHRPANPTCVDSYGTSGALIWVV